MIPYGTCILAAVRRVANCYTPFTFTLPLLSSTLAIHKYVNYYYFLPQVV